MGSKKWGQSINSAKKNIHSIPVTQIKSEMGKGNRSTKQDCLYKFLGVETML